LNLDLLMRAFFFLGDWGLFQCMDCLLVSGSYWKIQVSSHIRIFGTNLAHLFHAQIVTQNLSNTFRIDVGKFRNCSNTQSAVSSNNSSNLLHILLSFRSGRMAQLWIVPDVFPTLLKLLKPIENLRARYTLFTIHFCQQTVSFCGRFSKFCEEFDVNTFYISTQHYSDGAQIRF